jgi:hypothetical protein
MKARVLDPHVNVYSTMDADSLSFATLTEGMEIEVGGAKRKAGKEWISITLATGQKAFIPGDTHLFAVREGALMQESVDMYAEPSSESPIKQQLTRNTKMSILEVKKADDERWVRIRDVNGNEGFISGETRIRVIQAKTKAMGRKNMLSGAMWLIAGGVIIYSGLKGTTGGSFALLGYGALLFGAVMFISGLIQFIRAPV